jgi:hypothetical protein
LAVRITSLFTDRSNWSSPASSTATFRNFPGGHSDHTSRQPT